MHTKNISVVILAAGAGTRMKSQTPKVLHRICGKPMLFYSIDVALQMSDDVHIILFHQKSLIAQEVIESYESAYNERKIHFHTQDIERFPGTGGALMLGGNTDNARESLPYKYDEILILNGDMPLVCSHTLNQMCQSDADIVMSILRLENPDGYGRVLIKDGEVQKIIEQKDATDTELAIKDVNAGVYKIHKKILQTYLAHITNTNAQAEFYLTDVIYYAKRDNVPIAASYVQEVEFMGVNTKVQLAKAQEVILQRLRNAAMEAGVIMHLPHTIYIESGVRFCGECVLEQGVQIIGDCEIKDSHIKAHSVIEQSIIESSDIGPFAHIRPKSHIKNTHIGNFVETKSSALNGVKAGHLSYLGDCEIGSGSNVGAGVITCNYDGKAKHKTIIGENVFIGSDTQLVAPIRIESNTLIGAGSTVTKDTQTGDLILTRVPQKHIKNGYFTFFTK